MKKIETELKFPKRFYWGASTSAHQIEGSNHNNWSVWELENAKSLAKSAEWKMSDLPAWASVRKQATDPDNYVSGIAVDHYQRYELDLALAEKLNLNAFRFSIEWSRIEPEEGVWSREAIDHYREYIREIKKRGMEPLPTLYHWTTPVWFSDRGGFEKSGNTKYFQRFAEKVIDEYHQDIRYITTINEPDTVVSHGYITLDHPPQSRSYLKAFLVYRNLLRAHKGIYKYAHHKSRRLKVGFTKSYAWVRAGDDRLITRWAVRADLWLRDDIVLWYVRRKLDFIGVNYYFSDRHVGLGIDNTNEQLNDLGWEMRPGDLKHVLVRLKKWNKPIIITESGVADHTDSYRKQWIASSLAAIHSAMGEGVDVFGYLHWSLLDNFEWAYGRWPRFGLIEIDYDNNLKRTVRPSGIWYAKLIKRMRGL
ncbi:MAG: family 1 glycosylhydrolase [Candidatus Saccharimonadales bacterium]